MSTTEKVDVGWLLLSVAGESLGEQESRGALRKAGSENPCIEAYRLAVEASRKHYEKLNPSGGMIDASYDQVKSKLPEMAFTWITSWGERASDFDIERAAQGLAAAQGPKEQYSHLRIFAPSLFPTRFPGSSSTWLKRGAGTGGARGAKGSLADHASSR